MAEKLKIIPLGGLNEIGKNMTVLEYGQDMIVVDCGLGFPEDDMYGVDLANLVNETALNATQRKAQAVELQDFTAAIERIVAGLERKNRVLNPKERETVAYHEMGHALLLHGLFLLMAYS